MERTPITTKTEFIQINGKTVQVDAAGDLMRMCFMNEYGFGVITMAMADISLTMINKETYLTTGDNGPLLFGPLTNDAAQALAALLTPTTVH